MARRSRSLASLLAGPSRLRAELCNLGIYWNNGNHMLYATDRING
jgi:hypothetical protein